MRQKLYCSISKKLDIPIFQFFSLHVTWIITGLPGNGFLFWPEYQTNLEQGKIIRADLKFIGKVESQTNNFVKGSVLAHFT